MRCSVLCLFALLLAATPATAQQSSPSRADGDAPYYFLLARHLEGEGKVDEAIAALKKAMTLAPESAEIQAELAALYARQDRPIEALDTAEEALKRDPTNREANRILGLIFGALAEQKKPLRPGDDPSTYQARAIAALEKARVDGGDLNIDLNLGRLQLRAGAFDKAIQSLRRVFTEQPEYTDGAMLLSAAQEGAGQVNDAILTMETALEYTPAFFRGHVRLIELYERQRRWKEAAAAYASAEKANPRADLTSGHAAALLNAGAPDEARALLEQVIGEAHRAGRRPDVSARRNRSGR